MNELPSSAKSVQYGLVIFLPDIIVAIDDAIKSWFCITPTGVGTGASNPAAVRESITILPSSFGSSSCNA